MKNRKAKYIGIVLLFLIMMGIIGFVEKKETARSMTGLHVKVKGISDVYFVEEKEIVSLLKNEFSILQEGVFLSEIDLNALEKKVIKHPFVRNAEVFVDHSGSIWVEVDQYQPVARIARPMAADGYISKEGVILPTSSNHTTRVLILEGKYAESLLLKSDISAIDPDLMALIKFINEDEFWSAQISELEIQKKNQIKMHQQVGNQVIEFGDAKDIEEKFQKINLVYEKILPVKGWNAYSRVNVKYKDQIICE
jgi:cell division protein FtsQ